MAGGYSTSSFFVSPRYSSSSLRSEGSRRLDPHVRRSSRSELAVQDRLDTPGEGKRRIGRSRRSGDLNVIMEDEYARERENKRSGGGKEY
jgi:hypothetical protein